MGAQVADGRAWVAKPMIIVAKPAAQAAILKLGGVKEGILRRDRLTWTGYIRDTVYSSILDNEWPDVEARLEQRLAHWEQTSR